MYRSSFWQSYRLNPQICKLPVQREAAFIGTPVPLLVHELLHKVHIKHPNGGKCDRSAFGHGSLVNCWSHGIFTWTVSRFYTVWCKKKKKKIHPRSCSATGRLEENGQTASSWRVTRITTLYSCGEHPRMLFQPWGWWVTIQRQKTRTGKHHLAFFWSWMSLCQRSSLPGVNMVWSSAVCSSLASICDISCVPRCFSLYTLEIVVGENPQVFPKFSNQPVVFLHSDVRCED